MHVRVMGAMAGPPGLAHVEASVQDHLVRALGSVNGVTAGSAAARMGWAWRERLSGALSLAIVFAWCWWAALLLGGAAVAFFVARWHWREVTLVMHGSTERLRRAHHLRKLALRAL